MDEYHTFEQQVNHELPDMRHEWKDDERDDIGFGVAEPWGESPKVPTVASVRVAANKAVRIAVLLHRGRNPQPLPEVVARAKGRSLHIELPQRWMKDHPLTLEDLEQERGYLKDAGFRLSFG